MGGDGGCVATRVDMVKTKGWAIRSGLTGRGDLKGNQTGGYEGTSSVVCQVSEDVGLGPIERRKAAMQNCSINQQRLQDPVVACRLGSLYSKQNVLNCLLEKRMPGHAKHIRSLKDVRDVKVKWAQPAEGSDRERRLVCPLTDVDLDGGNARAVVIWSTGAVLAEKALKTMVKSEKKEARSSSFFGSSGVVPLQSDEKKDGACTCPVTGHLFDAAEEVILLAAEGEELEKLQKKLPQPKEKKKRKADEFKNGVSEDANPGQIQKMDENKKVKKETSKWASSKALDGKSELYKSLFHTKSCDVKGKEGLTGLRDGFGCPTRPNVK